MSFTIETEPPVTIGASNDGGITCEVQSVSFKFESSDNVPFFPSSEPLKCYPLTDTAHVILSSKNHVRRASVLYLTNDTPVWKSMKSVCPDFWKYGQQLGAITDITSILEALKIVTELQTKVRTAEGLETDAGVSSAKMGLECLSLGRIITDFSDSCITNGTHSRKTHRVILASNWPWISDKFIAQEDQEGHKIVLQSSDKTIDVLAEFLYGQNIEELLDVDTALELLNWGSESLLVGTYEFRNAELPPGLLEKCINVKVLPGDFVRLWREPKLTSRMEEYFKENKQAVMNTEAFSGLSKVELMDLLRL